MTAILDLARREKLLDDAGLDAAARGGGSAEALVGAGVSDAALAAALSRRLGVPVIDLGGEEIETDALRLVPHDLAGRLHALPLGVDFPPDGSRRLRVALADPTDAAVLSALENATDCVVDPVLARLGDLAHAIPRAYRGINTVVMPDRRVPFGGNLDVAATSARGGVPTQPFHNLEDEAPAELRGRALLELLVKKGLVTHEEYLSELRRLLQERA
jgi:hypothetical protein